MKVRRPRSAPVNGARATNPVPTCLLRRRARICSHRRSHDSQNAAPLLSITPCEKLRSSHASQRAAEAALKNRTTSFVIDGEAVLLGVDGISDFNGLHSRQHNDQVKLYAFDILALDGDDLRTLPLHLRKEKLARLLAKRPEGIFVSDYEQGEIGPELFLQACKFGLEGIVSKHKDRPYRPGRSPHWIKIKNRSHPALARVKEAFS